MAVSGGSCCTNDESWICLQWSVVLDVRPAERSQACGAENNAREEMRKEREVLWQKSFGGAKSTGQVSQDLLFHSYSHTASRQTLLESKEECHTYLMKSLAVDRTPVADWEYMLTLVVAYEQIHTISQRPACQLLESRSLPCPWHAVQRSIYHPSERLVCPCPAGTD